MVYGGGRKLGKTTKAIELSNQTGNSILCANQVQAKYIKFQAEGLGLDIPDPIFFKPGLMDGLKGKFIVDEIEWVFKQITGLEISDFTTSMRIDVNKNE